MYSATGEERKRVSDKSLIRETFPSVMMGALLTLFDDRVCRALWCLRRRALCSLVQQLLEGGLRWLLVLCVLRRHTWIIE